MSKHCFITCGPESSGNHLITNLLLSWGCWGQADGIQSLDQENWADLLIPPGRDLVWLRSLPHGSVWPDFDQLSLQIRRYGYLPHVVIIVRSKFPTIVSQLNHERVLTPEEGSYKYAYGLALVLNWCITHCVPYSLVTYEGIIHSRGLQRALCAELQLVWSDLFAMKDENPKHLKNI